MTDSYRLNPRGQALVELATFGTVLLLSLAMLVNYGLQANYQQEMEMKTFRKAMQQAYTANGPSASVALTVIEDKPTINTQDAYGLGESAAFGSAANVTWDNDLMDDYDTPGKDYLPRLNYEINGVKKGYTTARFVNYDCIGEIYVRIPDRNDINNDGRYWRKVPIDCATQTKVLEEELLDGKIKVGYIKNDAYGMEKEPIGSIAMTSKGKQKLVVRVEGALKGPIASFTVLDSQEGEIDTTIDPIDANGNLDLRTFVDKRQGLLPNFSKEIRKSGTSIKNESKTNITTSIEAFLDEKVTRKVRLNKRPEAEIVQNLPQIRRTNEWIVSK